MGQSAPTPSLRTQRRQQLKQQDMQKPLQATEQVRHHQPTLKEQWQAKREANAAAREANAAERKRKKDALHAALVAQQKQAECEENLFNLNDGVQGGGGDGSSDDDHLPNAEAEAMLIQAQINAQLAAFQTFMQNNPDVGEDLDSVDATPASMFNRDAATIAALKAAKSGGLGDGDDDEAIANVSVHTSDYADEELMQDLDDLDEELEQEFLHSIDTMQHQVAEHKKQSLVYLREHNDKAAALQELQKAKQIEANIKKLLGDHETPLRVQIEEQQTKIVELENLVATRKQQSLAALHDSDKPTALTLLKEAKGFASQLEAVRAMLASLREQKEKQLRSTGEG
ncbi:hypothetical protein LPMP_204980 [Leishmania panamensis]|uniref:Uncharacterized protein n=2 Tax=Leishmania guyanensis species complex TaxID=38579 RepID=A0A088RQ50_LEIPA|nr:hypothetical protein LPMP_204980 [Leishmania panamensis]AIN97990.1 hypothetical protein LPMP_204980 [Leishmania panamensis]CCM15225.1 hypothetical protein, unknown function [Leishmania guyanensis]